MRSASGTSSVEFTVVETASSASASLRRSAPSPIICAVPPTTAPCSYPTLAHLRDRLLIRQARQARSVFGRECGGKRSALQVLQHGLDEGRPPGRQRRGELAVELLGRGRAA